MPSLSNIRERALQKVLDRRAAYAEKHADVLTALQDRRSLDLSLDELARQRQALAYYAQVIDRQDELLQSIRNQNKAIEADKAANPLRPAARRSYGPSAILGILERERRHTAPLSRGAYARAQALAASRSKLDMKSAYRKSGTPMSQSAAFRGEADFYDLHGVSVSPADVGVFPDPCVEFERRERVRREVMFARGFAERGYRGRHFRKVC